MKVSLSGTGINITPTPATKPRDVSDEIIGFAQDILDDLADGRYGDDPADDLKQALIIITEWRD